ncbi:MAG: T9SS type A sorting domain-containing protein, partial [Paludibacteraceae bacterium]|nr:T9SS type A sorting domain-containing protein [Paludibacteraceae bacterium]
SVCNLNKDDIIIYSSENNILIENIPLQSTIKVYDVNGRMIHTNINNTSRYKIQIPTNHIFFIQIITSHSNKTFKILL